MPTPTIPNAAHRLILAVALLSLSHAQADVAAPEGGNKPGFLKRIFGGKDTPAPAPTPEEVKEAPKAAPASSDKREKITIKPKGTVTKSGGSSGKSGGSSKSGSSTTAKKSTPAPAKEAALPAKNPEPVKPEEIEKKTAEAMPAKSKSGDGEFDTDDDDKQTAETKPATPAPEPEGPHTPLPTNTKNTGWQVVKVSGRDYVTGESIHNFYRFSSYKVDGKHVWLRSNNLILKAAIGSQEVLINNIKFVLSFPVLESGGKALFSRLDLCKLIDPVLRPTYITDAEPFDTVVLDAGHGGHDAGARGVYGYEKDFALKMSYVVRDALQKKGFKVVLSRPVDSFVSLSGRVALANATPRSIFISLHFNSGGSSVATGIETFALTPQGSSASLERGGGFNYNGLTGNSHDSANIALATAVHAMVISRFKFVDRGIKRAQWSVLTGCKRPGILFEGGFVTNGNECRLIASDTYRTSVASAIADAVVNYRTALRGAMTKQR